MSHQERPPRTRLTPETAARLSHMCKDLTEAEAEDLLGSESESEPTLARLRASDASEVRVRAALAELEKVLRRRGLVGAGTVPRGDPPTPSYRPLPGVGPSRSLEEVYVCPGNLCDRVEIPRAADPEGPPCAVWASPLPRFRIDR